MRSIATLELIGLLQGCAPKQEIQSSVPRVTIVSTVPLARHVAADVIQEGQAYEGNYWKMYRIEGVEYTLLYKPLGESGVYEDDLLILQYGKTAKVEFVDVGVVGGISYVVSLEGKNAAPYTAFPEKQRKEISAMYLGSLLAINAELTKTENIKALEAIIPP